jgi:hypothetical protein
LNLQFFDPTTGLSIGHPGASGVPAVEDPDVADPVAEDPV